MNKNNILTLYKSPQTVFSLKDIALLWRESHYANLKSKINYYVGKGDLLNIRRGFYAKDKNYNKFELATRIFTPAYVSFETVLGQHGLTFQYYSQIFVASYLSRDIDCDGQIYSFKKIKNQVLTDKAGLENKGEYMIAGQERAFLDTIYINKDYHFDNLSPLDWDKVFLILPIYHNQRMADKVKTLFKQAKNEV